VNCLEDDSQTRVLGEPLVGCRLAGALDRGLFGAVGTEGMVDGQQMRLGERSIKANNLIMRMDDLS
jgi:hypothetical protein